VRIAVAIKSALSTDSLVLLLCEFHTTYAPVFTMVVRLAGFPL
jgi:hypothetical protein